jgi:WD40 repeat protein
LATGGRDKALKVWDLKSSDRKPCCNIQTIASVSRVRWRPGFETHIAASSLANDSRIHIWDMKKPFVPSICLDRHENSVTSIQWLDSSSLYSCSKDESFALNNLVDGYKPRDFLASNVCTWDQYGGIGFALSNENYENEEPSRSTFSFAKTSPDALPKQDFKHSNTFVPLAPKQIFGILNARETFEYASFAYLAHYYKADPTDIAFICSQNANV